MAAKNSFHIMQIAYDKFADSYYIPVSLEHDDYPNLIAPGETLETLGQWSFLRSTIGREILTGS